MKIIIIITIIAIILLYFFLFHKLISNFTNTNIFIPKNIYLSYKTKNIPDYIIPTWKKLNPEYNIVLYDNNDCINFLETYYKDPIYVDIFNYIKDGPIKADFWRVCILNKFGGVYSDIDVKPLVPINEFMEEGVSFLTCLSYIKLKKNNINPHFIISTPNHPVLQKCIDTYITKYKNKDKYNYWKWSIVYIMTYAINMIFNEKIKEGIIYDKNNNKYQFLQEIMPTPFNIPDFFYLMNKLNGDKEHNCVYKDKIILYNRYEDYNNHGFV